MSHRFKLFEFLCKLTDIQIKKYVSLATVGVGPDARLNAKLVLNEVDELLGFSEQLLVDMQTNSDDNSLFIPLFNQVTFYIQQEYNRSYAGWLLDENQIHSTVKERVIEQLDALQDIAMLIDLDMQTAVKPLTRIQKQCEYDSCAIAYRILDLAIKVKTNPDDEIATNIPIHARNKLKSNATTRYVDYFPEIQALHSQYDNFLSSSECDKSDALLQGEEAKEFALQHTTQWTNLLNQYEAINPLSTLFSQEFEWYKVGVITKAPVSSLHASNHLKLFGGMALAGVLLVYMLMQYFTEPDEMALYPIIKF
jgi:hypothetical protein